MLTVHAAGMVIVWLPLEPPLKLKPPCALVAAPTIVTATVLALASYDKHGLIFVVSGSVAPGARATASAVRLEWRAAAVDPGDASDARAGLAVVLSDRPSVS
jgi:hypothetical protein